MVSEGKRERERGKDDLITIAHSVNHLPLKNMKIAKIQEKPDQLRCVKYSKRGVQIERALFLKSLSHIQMLPMMLHL